MAVVRYLETCVCSNHVISPKVLEIAFKSPGTRQGQSSYSDRRGLEVPWMTSNGVERVVPATGPPQPPSRSPPQICERAAVSSCWEEVILALEVREGATSG